MADICQDGLLVIAVDVLPVPVRALPFARRLLVVPPDVSVVVILRLGWRWRPCAITTRF